MLFKTNRPAFLLVLIALQLGCAVFFVADVFADYAQNGPRSFVSSHLILEALATLVLVAAMILEIERLGVLLHRHAHLKHNVAVASAAMNEIVEDQFARRGLTRSERDVAMLVVKGFPISEIASIWGNAEGTIKSHLNSIYRKSGTTNRAEMLSLFIDPLMDKPLLATKP